MSGAHDAQERLQLTDLQQADLTDGSAPPLLQHLPSLTNGGAVQRCGSMPWYPAPAIISCRRPKSALLQRHATVKQQSKRGHGRYSRKRDGGAMPHHAAWRTQQRTWACIHSAPCSGSTNTASADVCSCRHVLPCTCPAILLERPTRCCMLSAARILNWLSSNFALQQKPGRLDTAADGVAIAV